MFLLTLPVVVSVCARGGPMRAGPQDECDRPRRELHLPQRTIADAASRTTDVRLSPSLGSDSLERRGVA
jgi:hypothetical protein